MSKSGFIILFGGPEFQPEDFLRDSILEPIFVHRGDSLSDGRSAEESWLEFADIHDGRYPLKAAKEALDFLQSHRDELSRLTRFRGVVTRTLHFFGDADSCWIELQPGDIALLHDLALCVSIMPDSQPNGGT